MKANQAEHSVATLCRVMKVSTSGYYAWLKRRPSLREQRDRELVGEIHRIHKMSRTSYGSPRIHREFRDDGIRVGRKRVERLMKRENLVGISRRKWVRTTKRCRRARPAPDLVDRKFVADGPDKLWVADITYIPTASGDTQIRPVSDTSKPASVVHSGMLTRRREQRPSRGHEQHLERRQTA
ncbi:MAG TPA: IS3 family transposase, partial [Candidatus Binatia bacterium]|nr:IS3 family transposase [Candidatus Binatia bacterium]